MGRVAGEAQEKFFQPIQSLNGFNGMPDTICRSATVSKNSRTVASQPAYQILVTAEWRTLSRLSFSIVLRQHAYSEG